MDTGAVETCALGHQDRRAQVATPSCQPRSCHSQSYVLDISLFDAFPDVPAFHSPYLALSLHSTSPLSNFRAPAGLHRGETQAIVDVLYVVYLCEGPHQSEEDRGLQPEEQHPAGRSPFALRS